MPTPTRSFLDVAAGYGEVDPNDVEAVQHWFTRVLPTLPPETIGEILEVLLESEGFGDDVEPISTYPLGVPLPTLSASLPAPIPLFAFGWREILTKLAGRSRDR